MGNDGNFYYPSLRYLICKYIVNIPVILSNREYDKHTAIIVASQA